MERQQDISLPYTCFSVRPAAGSSARAHGAEWGDAPTQRICASAFPGTGTHADTARSSARKKVMNL